MHKLTATPAGSDLLSGILGVEIRNEEKITNRDRLYCERQQELLYNTLDQIDRWYGIFTKEAEKYRESHRISYKGNGEICYRGNLYPDDNDYSHHEFKPFKSINGLVSANFNASQNFAGRIIGYFNRTYNVSVPTPEINGDTLAMGFRPQYMTTYVDAVIEHLGGRSFRQTAEEELLRRFHNLVKPGRWSKVKPELKGDKISFPNIVGFDDFYYEHCRKNHVHYNSHGNISTLCEGIAFGSDNLLCGDERMVMRLDKDDVDVSGWYDLTATNATGMKFFRNGRVDVRFMDRETASHCFSRLGLDGIRLHEE